MFDFKHGPSSILKELFPKDEGNEDPFGINKITGTNNDQDDDVNKEGCFEKAIGCFTSLGPMGCILALTGGAGIFAVLFGG
mgnify:CR=1 FL=1